MRVSFEKMADGVMIVPETEFEASILQKLFSGINEAKVSVYHKHGATMDDYRGLIIRERALG